MNQITRTLAELIKPIAASKDKAPASSQSEADRDALGNGYDQQEKSNPDQHPQNPQSDLSEKPKAQVIQFPGSTPEEVLEARKKAIGVSQAWIGLVTALEKQKSNLGEQIGRWFGSGAYEKANTGTSKAARAKKGVIVDKKAA